MVSMGTPKPFGEIAIKSNTGENFINPKYVLNSDGTIGFIEDVSSYGNQLVQNTIKQRGSLRGTLEGIKTTEDAHHIIPVQLLKENDVVQAAVKANPPFAFNSIDNGMAIEKFVKATGQGRHGPHPNYTDQIRTKLNEWAAITPNYTPQQAKDFLDIISVDVKNTITTSSGKINELNLGL